MSQEQINAKRKEDAQNTIFRLYKLKKEEMLLIDEIGKPEHSQQEREKFNEKLKIVSTSKKIAKKRLEWLLQGTNFTIAMLEEEMRSNPKSVKGMKLHELGPVIVPGGGSITDKVGDSSLQERK